MSDAKKAALLAFVATIGFLIWLGGQLRYLKPYAGIVLHGSIRPGSAITHAGALGLLLVGLFLSVFGLCFRLFWRVGNRDLGQHLHPATRELRHGLPGMERLKAELERR